MFYVLLVTSAFLLHFCDRDRVSTPIFYLFSLFVLLTMALRGNGTGLADYNAYISIYLDIVDWYDVLNPTTHVEIGFRIVSFLGNTFNLGGQFIIVFMALASFIPVVLVIKKYSPYKLLSIVVWFPYIMSMNMQSSRISVAVGFGLLFFICYYHKHRLLSILCFILAVSFHTSLILLVCTFLTRLRLSVLASTYFVILFLSFLIGFSVIFASALSLIGLDVIAVKFLSYVNSEHYGYPMRVYDPRVLISVFMVAAIMLLNSKITNPFHTYLFKLFVIGSMVLVAFMDVTILAWRLSYIFLIIGVLVVPIVSKYFLTHLVRTQKLAYLAFPGMYLALGLIIAIVAQPYILFFGGI